ncbi:hypothetical protein HJB86_32230 [Rhizobium sp. NZLR3b]|uniref:GlcG/HbpS family heme-binding protein n=1 Tax=Rhizobium sp. NZLR3b TaxID=2731101 RepID=UPI001C830119|nr:heme-binding protein [Rhizobium sp. NZLR3b]MBX5193504.1 hypothetical protein [Rhizobium sp. NZLR3b]
MDLLVLAKKIADHVEAQGSSTNVPVAVSVIDAHGNIVLQHRMTGSPTFSIELSERKVYTFALVGKTADLLLVSTSHSHLRRAGNRRSILKAICPKIRRPP